MNLLVTEDRKWTVQETRLPKAPVAGNESESEVHFVYKCSKIEPAYLIKYFDQHQILKTTCSKSHFP